jgi:hypothetical protein
MTFLRWSGEASRCTHGHPSVDMTMIPAGVVSWTDIDEDRRLRDRILRSPDSTDSYTIITPVIPNLGYHSFEWDGCRAGQPVDRPSAASSSSYAAERGGFTGFSKRTKAL